MRLDDVGPGEPVVFATRPAATRLIWPVWWFLLIGAALGVALGWMPAGWRPAGPLAALVAAGVLVVALVLAPLAGWLGSEFVLTAHRVRLRGGVLRRTTHDVLLAHVQEVTHTRSWWQKLRGAGTLLLTTTSGGVVRVPDLPQIDRLHALVAELAWAQHAGRPPAA